MQKTTAYQEMCYIDYIFEPLNGTCCIPGPLFQLKLAVAAIFCYPPVKSMESTFTIAGDVVTAMLSVGTYTEWSSDEHVLLFVHAMLDNEHTNALGSLHCDFEQYQTQMYP